MTRCEKMAKRERKQMTEEDKRKRSEVIQKITLPMANAAVVTITKVMVEHLLRGV